MDQAGPPDYIAFVLESGNMASLIQWAVHHLTLHSHMVGLSEKINQQSNV